MADVRGTEGQVGSRRGDESWSCAKVNCSGVIEELRAREVVLRNLEAERRRLAERRTVRFEEIRQFKVEIKVPYTLSFSSHIESLNRARLASLFFAKLKAYTTGRLEEKRKARLRANQMEGIARLFHRVALSTALASFEKWRRWSCERVSRRHAILSRLKKEADMRLVRTYFDNMLAFRASRSAHRGWQKQSCAVLQLLHHNRVACLRYFEMWRHFRMVRAAARVPRPLVVEVPRIWDDVVVEEAVPWGLPMSEDHIIEERTELPFAPVRTAIALNGVMPPPPPRRWHSPPPARLPTTVPPPPRPPIMAANDLSGYGAVWARQAPLSCGAQGCYPPPYHSERPAISSNSALGRPPRTTSHTPTMSRPHLVPESRDLRTPPRRLPAGEWSASRRARSLETGSLIREPPARWSNTNSVEATPDLMAACSLPPAERFMESWIRGFASHARTEA